MFVFLMSCDCKCSVAVPRDAVPRFAMYDCGICRSYWLTFFNQQVIFYFQSILYLNPNTKELRLFKHKLCS